MYVQGHIFIVPAGILQLWLPHHILRVHSLKLSQRWVMRLFSSPSWAFAQAWIFLWSYESRNIINIFQVFYKHLIFLYLWLLASLFFLASLFLAPDDLTASDSCDFEQLSLILKSNREIEFCFVFFSTEVTLDQIK